MMRRVLLLIVGGAALAVTGIFLWGMSLPETAVASRVATIRAPVGEVFAVVTDVPRQAQWRSDVGRIEIGKLPGTWQEHVKDGSIISFRMIERQPNRSFEIAYTSTLGFEGRWRGVFEAESEGTRLNLTESVTIASPLKRAIARLMTPPGAHLDLYVADLRRAVDRQAGRQDRAA